MDEQRHRDTLPASRFPLVKWIRASWRAHREINRMAREFDLHPITKQKLCDLLHLCDLLLDARRQLDENDATIRRLTQGRVEALQQCGEMWKRNRTETVARLKIRCGAVDSALKVLMGEIDDILSSNEPPQPTEEGDPPLPHETRILPQRAPSAH